ncbi:RES family NAD+ phosphorylase [Streptomyces sp. NPDC058746]|uniref:RES family NAD+ phosphorylase n=1 Tax=Streptomyces sp. NPDC058746 TaxID=3346622 RepID=UPI003694B792
MRHITDAFLRSYLGRHVSATACSYCDAHGDGGRPVAVPFDLVAQRVLAGVRNSTVADFDAVGTSAVDSAVLRAVKELAYVAAQKPRTSPHESWPEFRERAKHQQRFTLLSDTGGESVTTLERISTLIESLGMISRLPAGHRIWRGRMINENLKPNYVAATIGSTPWSRATANRLSPAGISLFYGSADAETVVAELSAHDPRPYAAVAVFELTRPVSVIDFTVTPRAPSIFDPEFTVLAPAIEFIRAFTDDLSRRVVLDGREHIEYVPTQLLTEYFRRLSPLRAEGILFHSAQNGGVNYALFTGPEGCIDAWADSPTAMLRLRPDAERVLERAATTPGRYACPRPS